jgi:hypothetical protein
MNSAIHNIERLIDEWVGEGDTVEFIGNGYFFYTWIMLNVFLGVIYLSF